MGLPLGLHDDDVDVCFPITEHHLENQVYRPARHAVIRGEIIELRNKSLHYIQKDPDRATAITAKLAHWWNDVEEILDSDDEITHFANKCDEILQHLSRRGSAWPEASAAAIRDLRAKMVNREAVAQPQDRRGTSSALTDGSLDLPSNQDLPEPSTHGEHVPSGAPIMNPAMGHMSGNEHLITGPTFDSGINLNGDPGTQNNLQHDPVLFDLGNYDWNYPTNVSGSVGQNGVFGEDHSLDPFSGFDIPFWFEQEQHWDMLRW
ncbi:hypothetical protein N0V83_004674 [Neocucurbitaria cava]|uniref:Uncharacterized protein n=1 Tax=Neocucurbitaria cava TaxID=798079 RepID=A0A9W8Y9M0_9PLEO|nr:hypothetical protein N0V83_004674 [Neocucurbitaria cava]